MKFKVSCELSYTVKSPSTFIFNIHAFKSPNQIILEEYQHLEPFITSEELDSLTENRFLRVVVDKPTDLKISYTATVDSFHQELDMAEVNAVMVKQLDGDMLPYIFASRYAQSDKLMRLAQDKFSHIQSPYETVVAITEWIHKNVEYVSGSTDAQTSAFDTVTERTGVCRDFAHLGIALCRAMNIPARYFTGYAYQLVPQDFHACFEAYIGGVWILFDATKLVPLNGLVKIASSLDAAQASVSSIFGNVKSIGYTVNCEALEPFVPFVMDPNKLVGIAY